MESLYGRDEVIEREKRDLARHLLIMARDLLEPAERDSPERKTLREEALSKLMTYIDLYVAEQKYPASFYHVEEAFDIAAREIGRKGFTFKHVKRAMVQGCYNRIGFNLSHYPSQ